MTRPGWWSTIVALNADLDHLLEAARPGLLSSTELLAMSQDVETFRRRLAVVDHCLVAALDARGVALEMGERNTKTLLTHNLRITPGEAAARVRAADELGPRTDFTGTPLPPLYPDVARAQEAGTLSAQHAQVITSTIRELPSAARGLHGDALEEFLVGQASECAPDHLARLARHATAVIDPDGTLASEDDHRRLRGLTITLNPDGSGDLRGRLTPECTAVVQDALVPLTKPAPAADDTPDPRTAAQRNHDAIQDLAQRLLRSGTLPDSGGAPATVLVSMSLEQLETRVGVATTSHGGLISVQAALRLAADADVIPVVLGDGGGVLAYGRANRHATVHQRRALASRDGGCSFPGCEAGPSWSQAHHILPWARGGRTDLGNLTLVCGVHHREHERAGWECQMINGAPHWRPPGWIDPERKPRRNAAHHVERFVLAAAA